MRDLLQPASECPGFTLRRLHAGELTGAEADAVRTHLAACGRCAATWERLEREQGEAPPLEDFAAGVQRKLAAARGADFQHQRPAPLQAGAPAGRWRRWVPLAVAAGIAVVAAVPLLREQPPPAATERIKGGTGLDVLVGGTGNTRLGADGERLAPGEHVRLRIHPGGHRFAIALSVDDEGLVSPLYDDAGASLAIPADEPTLLPDALAFDGSGGERIYLFLSDEPLRTEHLASRLGDAFRAAGSAAAMGDLPGIRATQSNLLVIKP